MTSSISKVRFASDQTWLSTPMVQEKRDHRSPQQTYWARDLNKLLGDRNGGHVWTLPHKYDAAESQSNNLGLHVTHLGLSPRKSRSVS